MECSQPLLRHCALPPRQARDRRFQAVLPLRGKILNVERNTDAAMYKNEEIAALIVALGLGLKGEAVPALRYGKARPHMPAAPARASHVP